MPKISKINVFDVNLWPLSIVCFDTSFYLFTFYVFIVNYLQKLWWWLKVAAYISFSKRTVENTRLKVKKNTNSCLSPVYSSNFYVTSFIYLPVNAPSTHAIFVSKQKIGDWDLWMTSKKLPIYVLSRLHGQFSVYNNFYLPQKLTRQFFSKYNCHTKTSQFCLSTRTNKNCHIETARVEGALSLFKKKIFFFLKWSDSRREFPLNLLRDACQLFWSTLFWLHSIKP